MAKQRKTDPDYILYTDGGCAVNPGGPGGYGTILIDCETGEIKEFSEGYFASTNNRMEVMAAIAGMEQIPTGSIVELHADSQYVLKTISGEFKKKKNVDLWKRLDQAMKGKEVHTVWVRGHNGDHYNEHCDELATEAMQAPTLVDSGYQNSNTGAIKQNHSGRSDIQIPDEYLYYTEEDRSVKDACKNQIKRLNRNPKPAFKDFANLKTGGIDGWSRMKGPEKIASAEICELLQNHFEKEQVILILRWWGRGLRLDYAIRKVFVDMEISENAMKARYR